jgi:hypothetical protein
LKKIIELNKTLLNECKYVLKNSYDVLCKDKWEYKKDDIYFISLSTLLDVESINNILIVIPLLYKKSNNKKKYISCHEKHNLEFYYGVGYPCYRGMKEKYYNIKKYRDYDKYNYYVERHNVILAFLIYGFEYEIDIDNIYKFKFYAAQNNNISNKKLTEFQKDNNIEVNYKLL